MGYSPWGHKELDTTERLSTAQQTALKRSTEEHFCTGCGLITSKGPFSVRILNLLNPNKTKSVRLALGQPCSFPPFTFSLYFVG